MHGGLLSLDWSVDGSHLVVNSAGHELLFVNTTKNQAALPESVCDLEWSTWTCPVGFPVQGVWPGGNSALVSTVAKSHANDLIASGEESGLVKLFRFPSAVKKAACTESAGHGSRVTRAAFSAKD